MTAVKFDSGQGGGSGGNVLGGDGGDDGRGRWQ